MNKIVAERMASKVTSSVIMMVIIIVLFIVVMLRIMLLPPAVVIDVALVIALSTTFSLAIAKIIGGSLPLIALACKQDPAAMAAPFITTCVDTVSLLVYFFLSVTILGI